MIQLVAQLTSRLVPRTISNVLFKGCGRFLQFFSQVFKKMIDIALMLRPCLSYLMHVTFGSNQPIQQKAQRKLRVKVCKDNCRVIPAITTCVNCLIEFCDEPVRDRAAILARHMSCLEVCEFWFAHIPCLQQLTQKMFVQRYSLLLDYR